MIRHWQSYRNQPRGFLSGPSNFNSMKDYFHHASAKSIVDNPKYLEPPKPVFGTFLFQNELGILFGDTNSAKSILAVDIGISYSSHVGFWGENAMTDSSINGKVLYYDLEQSTRQFARRYIKAPFVAGQFERISFSIMEYGNADVEQLILEIESRMEVDVPQLIIVDNVQCVLAQNLSITKVKHFMQKLKMLKELNPLLTILIVAHTIKRDLKKPLTQNCMAGSKVIANFADSIFGISDSTVSSSTRYIKQLKAREVPRMEEVAVCNISDDPYLHLELLDFEDEKDHLEKSTARRTSQLDDLVRHRIIDLHEEGESIRDIASELGISKSHVHRVINGQV